MSCPQVKIGLIGELEAVLGKPLSPSAINMCELLIMQAASAGNAIAIKAIQQGVQQGSVSAELSAKAAGA